MRRLKEHIFPIFMGITMIVLVVSFMFFDDVAIWIGAFGLALSIVLFLIIVVLGVIQSYKDFVRRERYFEKIRKNALKYIPDATEKPFIINGHVFVISGRTWTQTGIKIYLNRTLKRHEKITIYEIIKRTWDTIFDERTANLTETNQILNVAKGFCDNNLNRIFKINNFILHCECNCRYGGETSYRVHNVDIYNENKDNELTIYMVRPITIKNE